jgi:hypothetical protein
MASMTRRFTVGVAVAIALASALLTAASSDPALEGRATAGGGSRVSAVEAAFGQESYRPGERARLVIRDRSLRLTIQVFQSGPERIPTTSDIEMNGVPVTPLKTITRAPGLQPYSLPVGRWKSGVYFARLQAPDGRVGFAPFVVSPARLGTSRVAVVVPTLTWQVYNFRDDDGDGLADSWYAGKRLDTVRLGRPHLDRGVPYGFRFHLGFLKWLHWTGRSADFLSQWDLERVEAPETLRRAYDLVIFAGHHEYVTTAEYDLVEGYRDLGGNLMFLSANNYFWRVERRGDVLVKDERWRDTGRPEAALVGVQYVAYQRAPRAPWVARPSKARSWLFEGTRLRPGLRFARGGVEIDQVTPDSPDGIQVVAEIPHLFGPGLTAQMTYYETPSRARVFAAGAFHFARAAHADPVVWRMFENLWRRLTHG